MAESTYLHRVQAINRANQPSDVERGMQAGEAIGKLLGGLGTAIQGAQKNALANRLMTQANISNQPGAGQIQDLGTLPSDGTGSDGGNTSSDDQLQQTMAASRLSSPSGQSQDLGQLPPDSPMTPDPSGAQIPTPSPQVSSDQLQQAMAAAQVGGGLTVGSISPPGGPQPAAQPVGGSPVAQPSGSDNWNLSGFGGRSGAGTVGGLIGTGGVQGLDLQKEMLAMQGTRATQANAQQAAALKLADAQAKASGTGPYALDAATKRAALAAAQAKATQTKTTATKPDPNAPPVDLTQAPVANNDQLVKAYESTHGKGSFAMAMNAFNEPATIPDPNNPGQTIPNPNAPVVTANTVSYGPAAKRTNLPIGEAQTFAKQANAQRVKQNLPLLPIPGQDPSLGSTAANPIPVQTNLDGAAVPHGKFIKTPTGQIIRRP